MAEEKSLKWLTPRQPFDPEGHWAGLLFHIDTHTRGCCHRLRGAFGPTPVACCPFVYRRVEKKVEPRFYVKNSANRVAATDLFNSIHPQDGAVAVPCLLPVSEAESKVLVDYLDRQCDAQVASDRWPAKLGWFAVDAKPDNLLLLRQKLDDARRVEAKNVKPVPGAKFEIGPEDSEPTAVPPPREDEEPTSGDPSSNTNGERQKLNPTITMAPLYMPCELAAEVLVCTNSLPPPIRAHVVTYNASARDLVNLCERAYLDPTHLKVPTGDCLAFRDALRPLVLPEVSPDASSSIHL